jgi:hypothetical protein
VRCGSPSPGRTRATTRPAGPPVSELGPDAAHWCTDYPDEPRINRYSTVKATGNDPATDRVLTTCQQRGPTSTDNCHTKLSGHEQWLGWTSPDLDIVDSCGRTSYSWNQTHVGHYRARWLVPGYT